MPIPLLGIAAGALARGVAGRAIGSVIGRTAASTAGRSMSASQLARNTSIAQGMTRSIRAARAGRMAAFSGSTSGSQTPSVSIDTTPHGVLRAPTMGGELIDG